MNGAVISFDLTLRNRRVELAPMSIQPDFMATLGPEDHPNGKCPVRVIGRMPTLPTFVICRRLDDDTIVTVEETKLKPTGTPAPIAA